MVTLLLEYSFQNRVFKFKVSWHLHYPPRKQVLLVLQTRKPRPREVKRPAPGQTPREAAGQSPQIRLCDAFARTFRFNHVWSLACVLQVGISGGGMTLKSKHIHFSSLRPEAGPFHAHWSMSCLEQGMFLFQGGWALAVLERCTVIVWTVSKRPSSASPAALTPGEVKTIPEEDRCPRKQVGHRSSA